MNKYYILALVFALASSMRIPLLPEIQYALVLLLLYKGSTRKVFFVIIIIFCTHHYAVPDAFFRFNADDYPSIYTKTIGLVKILDILIITIFLFSLSKIHSLKKIFNKSLPLFVIPFAFLGLFTINSETFHEIIFLFSLRSLLLLISIFLLANSLTSRDLIFSAKLAMFSWALKMLFAILIPQEFPLYREIFGFQGIVFFAGDEYLTIGIYLSLLLLLSTKDSLSFLKIFTFINFVFLLTLIAQRKGGIPYFVILNVILIFYFYINKIFLHRTLNILLILKSFYLFFFLIYVVPNLDPLIATPFREYQALAQSALDSVLNQNLFSLLFGVSPWGKYELINLNPVFDHSMSFGKEVGEVYRYAIWAIPGGRLILNVGLLGMILFYMFLLYTAVKSNSVEFYLALNVFILFYFSQITPVSAVAIGVGLAGYLRYREYKSVNLSR